MNKASPIQASSPIAGFYKTRLAGKGPWVPAELYLADDQTNEFGLPVWHCELPNRIMTDTIEVLDMWPYLAKHPIDKTEYDCMVADLEHARAERPLDAMAMSVTEITEPGIYTIPASEYHADPCPQPSLSASIAWTMLNRSPLHCWTKSPRLNPDFEPEEKAIFDLGKAAHNMVLRQDYWREEITVIDAPDWRTKAAKEQRDEAREAGRYPLLQEQYERIDQMVRVVEHHSHAKWAFVDGKPEQTLIWRDGDTGIWLRCRPDFMPNDPRGPWPDYKTTQDAKPGAWDRRFITDHGGILRAAFYEAGIRACTGVDKVTQFYVVQETAPPHAVVVRVVEDSALMDVGRAMLRKAIAVWAKCLRMNHWPSYELFGALQAPRWTEDAWAVEYADWMQAAKPKAEMEVIMP